MPGQLGRDLQDKIVASKGVQNNNSSRKLYDLNMLSIKQRVW